MSNTQTLPDPRETAAAANHPLFAAAAQTDDAALPAALQQALVAGDDNGIRAALGVQPPARAQRVARMLAAALDAQGNGIGLRFFAIPLVIVAGARKPCAVQGALPEVHVLRGLLEQHGAVGVTRNFGLGNALVSAEALDALLPSALWRAAGDPAQLLPALDSEETSRGPHHLRQLDAEAVCGRDDAGQVLHVENAGHAGVRGHHGLALVGDA